jgi:hypothetical protein
MFCIRPKANLLGRRGEAESLNSKSHISGSHTTPITKNECFDPQGTPDGIEVGDVY